MSRRNLLLVVNYELTELYRHFDKENVLLYVGISKHTLQRYYDHRTQSKWWRDSVKITIERYETREEAEVAERAAIRNEKPLYNKVHSLTDSEKKQHDLPIKFHQQQKITPHIPIQTNNVDETQAQRRRRRAKYIQQIRWNQKLYHGYLKKTLNELQKRGLSPNDLIFYLGREQELDNK